MKWKINRLVHAPVSGLPKSRFEIFLEAKNIKLGFILKKLNLGFKIVIR